ncbi:hypothetical protein ACFL58_04330 [Elusimicrobiota bacterium]
MKILKLLCLSLFFSSICSILYASSLSLETDYRLRGISYNNTEINTAATTPVSYYSQKLEIALKGNFEEKGIEIGSRIKALGVVGSSQTLFAVPCETTDFTPFIENAYLKINDLGDSPIDITVGKQPLIPGNGLIFFCEGVNALKFSGDFNIPMPFSKTRLPLTAEYFTAKLSESLAERSDSDLHGIIAKLNSKNDTVWEIGYFTESDFSGTEYVQGTNTYSTKAIVKNFLDFRVSKKIENISEYSIEFANQTGYVKDLNGSDINFNGFGYVLSGKLINKNSRLGKVVAKALLSYSTGDDDTLSYDDDESFSPTHTKKYDGLERYGYGTIMGATPSDAFFELPSGYSGINTLLIGTDISPIYAWTIGIDFFLFSTSQGPKGAPQASGFERFYGAEYSLGSEMDFSLKFAHSKYTDFKVIFGSYEPPAASIFWPNSKNVTTYRFEVSSRF